MTVGVRFVFGILAGFTFTGVLFFTLLALWSVFAGPFVRLQSASFVIVCSLCFAGSLGIRIYRGIRRRLSKPFLR